MMMVMMVMTKMMKMTTKKKMALLVSTGWDNCVVFALTLTALQSPS